MNLICFFESVYPENNAGAIRAHYFIQALKKANPNSRLLVLTGTQNPYFFAGVQFISLSKQKESLKSRSFIKRAIKECVLGVIVIKELRALYENGDILFISSPSYLASIFVAMYAIVSNKAYFFEVRDIYPQAFRYAGVIKEGGVIDKIFSFISRTIYRKSLLNVCATNGLAKEMKEELKNAKLLVSQNGFPKSLIDFDHDKYSRFTIVFHGTLGVFQDIELLCKLVHSLNMYEDIDIIVIGTGLKSHMIVDAEKHNPNLKYLGGLSHKDTMDIVSRCHVGLSFRYDDRLSMASFPVKNWEYLGLAIPSIITPVTSEAGRFLTERGCAIPLETTSVNSITKELLRIKNDSNYYQGYVDSCKRIRASYTRESTADTLVRFLLNNKP